VDVFHLAAILISYPLILLCGHFFLMEQKSVRSQDAAKTVTDKKFYVSMNPII
jgi:hypothetical protein